jgi:hypothetical protein
LTQQIYTWVASTRPFLLSLTCLWVFALAGCGGGSGSPAAVTPQVGTPDRHDPWPTASPNPNSPSPSPSQTPKGKGSDPAATPSPTPSGASGTTYSIDGCDVYGPNDWFTSNLTTGGSSYAVNTVDPNSANIISNYISAQGGGSPTLGVYENGGIPVNEATNSTPSYTLPANGGDACKYGCYGDPYGDPTGMPWLSSFYVESGPTGETVCGEAGSTDTDCHMVALNTQTCVDYEAWGTTLQNAYPAGFSNWGFNGSGFTSISYQVSNLGYSFNTEWVTTGANRSFPTASNLPLVGTLDTGEDYEQYIANGKIIPHILYVTISGSPSDQAGIGGWVEPAGASGSYPCQSHCTYTLPEGARLLLKPSFNCSTMTNTGAHYICLQLQTYGMIVSDTTGNVGGRMFVETAPTANYTDPWTYPTLGNQIANIPISDFEVMTLGTVNNCPGCGP